MMGLPAYFLGNQEAKDAMLVPEVVIFRNPFPVQDFKWKSAEEQKPFTLFSIAICIFAKKECRSELEKRGKLFPSY